MKKRALYLSLFVVTLMVFISGGKAFAGDKYWLCGTDSWNNADCWSDGSQPQAGDNAYVHYNLGNPVGFVDYVNAADPTLEYVEVDSEGSNWLVLLQNQDTLTTNYLTAGNTQWGVYTLDGTGSLVVNNNFTLGNSDLSRGYFTQNGGSVSISGGYGALTMGRDQGATGQYFLVDGNLTLASGEELIGDSGYGEINQYGGIHEINGVMYLGNQSTGFGKYTMTGGELIEGAGGGSIVLGEWGGTGFFSKVQDQSLLAT